MPELLSDLFQESQELKKDAEFHNMFISTVLSPEVPFPFLFSDLIGSLRACRAAQLYSKEFWGKQFRSNYCI